ncbi:hypothetical protein OS493_006398 [Desmophyllum pertusum]|uniref:Protein kinase domain-containing protein n=1 Tax=Desmophyllum pertusum TaxID=174260 RepID=A0A9X0A5I6_9CNID|nr:hypothetical protein OS493_006398 [Desmophyllum pertusum]
MFMTQWQRNQKSQAKKTVKMTQRRQWLPREYERRQRKETAKQESSESESESRSEESSDDEDEEKEEGDAQKKSKMKMKQQKETEVKVSGSKELLAKNNDDDESSSDEEESSEEESDEEESESDSSEESEETKEVVESTNTEEFESEDLHMELQQLKRQRPSDEKHKQKVKAERHHREEREHRRRGQSSLDTRGDIERKTSEHETEKTHLKYQRVVERRHSQSKHKSRSYEKGRADDVVQHVDRKERSDKHKSYAKESSKDKPERPDQKSSRKESEKRVKSSADESARIETTGKDWTDRSGSRRRASASEKPTKERRGGEEGTWPSKPKKDEGKSVILTERERRQFTNEVVDIESEGSSEEDEKDTPHPDVEMKLSDGEQEGNEKGIKKTKLATYFPAVRGCRNVEEFQWLNRIEEGTYGVVYRA